MVLEMKKIPFQFIDVAADEEAKKRMRELSGNPNALPPQLFNEDKYCGDYDAFVQAIEEERLEAFLKLK